MTKDNPENLDLDDIGLDIEPDIDLDTKKERALNLGEIDLKKTAKNAFNPSLPIIDEEVEEDLKDDDKKASNTNLIKEFFKEITAIVNDSEDKKSERITELKDDYQSDKGLSIFGESAVAVIDSEKFDHEEKKQITGELNKQFGFIENDDYPQKTDEEKTELASAALINTVYNSTIKENGEQDAELTKKMTDSFAQGLKKSAPEIIEESEKLKKSHEIDEEESIKRSPNNTKKTSSEEAIAGKDGGENSWDDTINLMRGCGKASLYLTLLLVVPPPLNLAVAALAFFLTKDIGVNPDKNQAAATENFQQQEPYENMAIDNEMLGNAASVVIDNGETDPENLKKTTAEFLDENKMDDEEKQLKTTKDALNQANEKAGKDDDKLTISSKAKEAVKGVINSLKNAITTNDNKNQVNNSSIPNQVESSEQSRQ